MQEGTQLKRQGDTEPKARVPVERLEELARHHFQPTLQLLDRMEHVVLCDSVQRWAVHPPQTHQPIVAALRDLADYGQRGTGYDSGVKDTYVRWVRFLNGDLSAAFQLGLTDREARSYRILLTVMP